MLMQVQSMSHHLV